MLHYIHVFKKVSFMLCAYIFDRILVKIIIYDLLFGKFYLVLFNHCYNCPFQNKQKIKVLNLLSGVIPCSINRFTITF